MVPYLNLYFNISPINKLAFNEGRQLFYLYLLNNVIIIAKILKLAINKRINVKWSCQ